MIQNSHEEALQRMDMITSKMCVKEGEIPLFFFFSQNHREHKVCVCTYISYDLCHNEVSKLDPFPPGFWLVFITFVSLGCQRKYKREIEMVKSVS